MDIYYSFISFERIDDDDDMVLSENTIGTRSQNSLVIYAEHRDRLLIATAVSVHSR